MFIHIARLGLSTAMVLVSMGWAVACHAVDFEWTRVPMGRTPDLELAQVIGPPSIPGLVGIASAVEAPPEAWSFDLLSGLTLAYPESKPSPDYIIAMGRTVDHRRGALVQFGGLGINTLGEWDLGGLRVAVASAAFPSPPQWTNHSAAPSARRDPGLIHDLRRDRYVVFGGTLGSQILIGDVWSVPAAAPLYANWRRDMPAVPERGVGGVIEAVYDSLGDQVWMMVANAAGAPEIWVLSLQANTWDRTQIPPMTPVGVQYGLSLDLHWVWDEEARQIIQLRSLPQGAGVVMHTLDVDTSTNWSEVLVDDPYPGAPTFQVHRDPSTGRIYLAPRSASSAVVAILEPGPARSWSALTLVDAGAKPSAREDGTLAYLPWTDAWLLVGGWYNVILGYCGPYLSTGFRYEPSSMGGGDGEYWSPAPIAGAPLGGSIALAVDGVHRRVFSFGGIVQWRDCPGGGTILSDSTHIFVTDPTPTWSPVATTGTPPSARYLHIAAFDTTRNRLLVFGGATEGGFALPSVHVLDCAFGAHWSTATTTGVTPANNGPITGVLDPVNDRWLVLDAVGQLHALALGDMSWSLVRHTAMTSRFHRTLGIDHATAALIAFGGDNLGNAVEDAWIIPLDSTLTPVRLVAPGPSPGAIARSASRYDPIARRLLVVGGKPYSGDRSSIARRLDGDAVTATLAGRAEWRVEHDVVSIRWFLAGPIAALRLARSLIGGTVVEDVAVVVEGRTVSAQDRDVTSGASYKYELIEGNGAQARILDRVVVTIPQREVPGQEFIRVAGAPGRETSLHLSIANTSSSLFEILDSSGRRLRHWDGGEIRAGEQTRKLHEISGLRPGLYWLRVRLDQRDLSCKLIVLS